MTPRDRMLAVWQELTERRAVLGAGLGVLVGALIAVILVLSASGGHRHAAAASSPPGQVPAQSTTTYPAPPPARQRPHRTPVHRIQRQPARSAGRAPATGGAAATPKSATSSSTTVTSTAAGTSAALAGSATVTLLLHGGGSATLNACGEPHHYRTYAAGGPVTASGTVRPVPSGRWKVKLRIKVCHGQAFTDFAKIPLPKSSSGAFSGSFNAPPKGDYVARAVLYVSGTPRAESSKRHFATH